MAKIDFGGTLATNRNAFKGIVSGLDTDALIEALVEKRQAPIKVEQDKIKIDNDKIQAFGGLRTKVNNLQAASAKLKGLNFMEVGENALQYKTATLSAATVESPESYLKISTDYNAQLGDFTIQVNQLAMSQVLQSSIFTDPNGNATTSGSGQVGSTLFNIGTFQINGAPITVNANDSINTIANKINSFTNTTNVSAQVVMTTTGTYNLILQSNLTGASNTINITDINNVVNGVINTATPLQQAKDAQFVYNGSMMVTRSSNIIDDFLQGVTIELISPTTTSPSGDGASTPFSVTAQIRNDYSRSASAVQDFIEAYNDLTKFVAQQQARDSNGNFLDSAKIRNNLMMETLISNIQTNALSLALPEESSLNIGIYRVNKIAANPSTGEPEYLNLMSFNETAFTNAINNNPQYVGNLLQFNAQNTETLKMYHSPTQIKSGALNFDIDITRNDSDIVKVMYTGIQYKMNFKPNIVGDLTQGGIFIGQENTPLEGMVIGYTGTGIETGVINFNQGIANIIYGILDENREINLNTGMDTIQQEISYILQDRTDRQVNINNKLEALDTYKQSLINRYSKLEAAIAKANMILTMIEIQVNLMGKSS